MPHSDLGLHCLPITLCRGPQTTNGLWCPNIGEALLMSTNNMFSWRNKKIYLQDILSSSGAMDIRGGTDIVFFLLLHENICCVYSLEVPHWGTSNEYYNICFCGEIRKISAFLDETRNVSIWHRCPCPVAILTRMQTLGKNCWKRAITLIIIGLFYPKLNLTYILLSYTCV